MDAALSENEIVFSLGVQQDSSDHVEGVDLGICVHNLFLCTIGASRSHETRTDGGDIINVRILALIDPDHILEEQGHANHHSGIQNC